MAERQLAGESHQEIPGLTQIGEIEHQDQNRQQIAVGDRRRCGKRQQPARNSDRGFATHRATPW